MIHGIFIMPVLPSPIHSLLNSGSKIFGEWMGNYPPIPSLLSFWKIFSFPSGFCIGFPPAETLRHSGCEVFLQQAHRSLEPWNLVCGRNVQHQVIYIYICICMCYVWTKNHTNMMWCDMIYDIWYMIYDIWYMMYDIWYMISDIWYKWILLLTIKICSKLPLLLYLVWSE